MPLKIHLPTNGLESPLRAFDQGPVQIASLILCHRHGFLGFLRFSIFRRFLHSSQFAMHNDFFLRDRHRYT